VEEEPTQGKGKEKGAHQGAEKGLGQSPGTHQGPQGTQTPGEGEEEAG